MATPINPNHRTPVIPARPLTAQQTQPAMPQAHNPTQQTNHLLPTRADVLQQLSNNNQAMHGLRQQALNRLNKTLGIARPESGAGERLAQPTLARQKLAPLLKMGLMHLPVAQQVDIYTGVQLFHRAAQTAKTQEFNRKSALAARTLTDETPEQWQIHPGGEGTPGPGQQVQYDRSMRKLPLAAALAEAAQLSSRCISLGMMVHEAKTNQQKPNLDAVANEIKVIPYALIDDGVRALVNFSASSEQTNDKPLRDTAIARWFKNIIAPNDWQPVLQQESVKAQSHSFESTIDHALCKTSLLPNQQNHIKGCVTAIALATGYKP